MISPPSSTRIGIVQPQVSIERDLGDLRVGALPCVAGRGRQRSAAGDVIGVVWVWDG